MSSRVSVGQLQGAIKNELDIFSEEVVGEVNDIASKIAKETVTDLTAASPKMTGDYAKGWRQKVESKQITGTNVHVIYNATEYRLIHLLEYGHVDSRTGKRTKAHPHVAEVEKAMIDKFEREVAEL